MKKDYIILLLIFILFVTSCSKIKSNTNSDNINEKTLINICIQACRNALSQNRNIDNGPCLLNPIKENPKWVCDVAHNPRIAIDNLPENQCQSFREGKANRFVEINSDCKLIKIG